MFIDQWLEGGATFHQEKLPMQAKFLGLKWTQNNLTANFINWFMFTVWCYFITSNELQRRLGHGSETMKWKSA